MRLLIEMKLFVRNKVESRYFGLHSPGKQGLAVMFLVAAPLPLQHRALDVKQPAIKNGIYVTLEHLDVEGTLQTSSSIRSNLTSWLPRYL